MDEPRSSLPGPIALGLLGLGVLPYFALGFLALGVWLRRLGLDAVLVLLALAPIAALGVALILRRRRRGRSCFGRLVLVGGLALVALAIVDHSRIWFESTIHLAYSENSSIRAEAIRDLRAIGSAEEVMARVSRTGRGLNPLSALVAIARGRRVEDLGDLMVRSLRMTSVRPMEDFWGYRHGPVEDFDELIYRVTGRIPNHDGDAFRTPEEFQEDNYMGPMRQEWRSEVVLLESRITGRIEPDEGWAHFAWALVLENRGGESEFAEATLSLPAGAVVTKATLEVAATASRAVLVRSEDEHGYSTSGNNRHDARLLLAGVGVDRVWIRANDLVSSRMTAATTIRLEFAAPVRPVDDRSGRLGLPSILTRSFALGGGDRLEVALAIPRAPASLPEGFTFTGSEIRAVVTNDRAAGPESYLPIPGRPGWARFRESGATVGPTPLVIVVDGSQDMARHAESVAEFLTRFPEGLEVAVVLAGDEAVRLTEGCVETDREGLEGIADRVRTHPYAGGADQLPALLEARRLAVRGAAGGILWIHTPQPLHVSNWRVGREILRALRGTPITGLLVEEGDCVASGALQGKDCRFAEWAGEGSVAARLEQIRRAWFSDGSRPAGRWERVGSGGGGGPLELAPALLALWARGAVRAGLHRDGDREEAFRLSKRHGILTPVAIAVVPDADE